MAENYEFKIGAFSDERIDVADLLKFLEAETNDTLAAEGRKATGGKSRDHFTSTFERIAHSDIDEVEYVGFLMIYNSANFESLEYVKRILAELGIKSNSQIFLIVVEMEVKEKVNLARNEGRLIADKYNAQFIRLSFENSGELLKMISNSVMAMLQGYYYNNSNVVGEEEQPEDDASQPPHKTQPPSHLRQQSPRLKEMQTREQPKHYELNYVSKDHKHDEPDVEAIEQQFAEEDDEDEGLIEKARRQRNSRVKSEEEQQREIDQNIENLQKVLQNMDVFIKSKVQTDWYENLRNSIFLKAEKESKEYCKIKLTQHFLQPTSDPAKPQRVPYESFVITSRNQLRKKPVLMRLQLNVGKEQVLLQVQTDSNYTELAKVALYKLGLKLTDKNMLTMKKAIETKIVQFVTKLQQAITEIQQQKLAKRRFIK